MVKFHSRLLWLQHPSLSLVQIVSSGSEELPSFPSLPYTWCFGHRCVRQKLRAAAAGNCREPGSSAAATSPRALCLHPRPRGKC